ncbi:hypothetical protein HDU85_005591 [Gaertneriomyces sp. JEL0708]|nr:hypothetical protein HDU85_005591 [Gaertneriomyces sp. JEL0708]
MPGTVKARRATSTSSARTLQNVPSFGYKTMPIPYRPSPGGHVQPPSPMMPSAEMFRQQQFKGNPHDGPSWFQQLHQDAALDAPANAGGIASRNTEQNQGLTMEDYAVQGPTGPDAWQQTPRQQVQAGSARQPMQRQRQQQQSPFPPPPQQYVMQPQSNGAPPEWYLMMQQAYAYQMPQMRHENQQQSFQYPQQPYQQQTLRNFGQQPTAPSYQQSFTPQMFPPSGPNSSYQAYPSFDQSASPVEPVHKRSKANSQTAIAAARQRIMQNAHTLDPSPQHESLTTQQRYTTYRAGPGTEERSSGIEYKPYGLKDFKELKEKDRRTKMATGLGPRKEDEEFRKAQEKRARMHQYGDQIARQTLPQRGMSSSSNSPAAAYERFSESGYATTAYTERRSRN